jgi:hypothetical protein
MVILGCNNSNQNIEAQADTTGVANVKHQSNQDILNDTQIINRDLIESTIQNKILSENEALDILKKYMIENGINSTCYTGNSFKVEYQFSEDVSDSSLGDFVNYRGKSLYIYLTSQVTCDQNDPYNRNFIYRVFVQDSKTGEILKLTNISKNKGLADVVLVNEMNQIMGKVEE